MDQLLSARQVQDTLKVDRTTIYRMIKDGRLNGIKVGCQWRFSSSEVQHLLSASPPEHPRPPADADEILPWLSFQPAQDVFAEMAEIGSVMIEPSGLPITRMSNPCEFCSLILESKMGRRACRQSWRQLASQTGAAVEFTACHAGLQYAAAPISISGETLAFLVGGQFHASQPQHSFSRQGIEDLAGAYGINPARLVQAAGAIRVLDAHTVAEITKWLTQVAKTFEQISVERADMLSRLHQISLMSQVSPRKADRTAEALDLQPVGGAR